MKPGAQSRALAVEDIVYRTFELLVFGMERPDPRLLGLRAVAELDPRSQKTVRQFPD
ncbi:MAG: hypothetical protein HS104_05070 [Polyangiaceae bacterium]|nr:hypothetical protein [Polyangiaceae bacterium]